MKLRKLLSLLLALVLVLSCVPCMPVAANTADADFYYGRSALATMDNAEVLLYAYDQLVIGMDAVQARITVREGNDTFLSADELSMVLDAYLRDHPEVFWFDLSYGYSATSDGNVKIIIPTYSYTGDTLAQMRATLDQQIAVFTAGIRDTMTDYEKEIYFHEALAGFITYGYPTAGNVNLSHTAYGGLVNGLAVCDGYTKSLQILLHAVGIRSFIAEGYSLDPSGNTVAHAWNYVELDGRFFHVDLTWNDQGDETFHAYLNLCDTCISEDHVVTPTAYPLPVCDDEEHMYFKYLPAYLEEYTVDAVAQLVVDHGMHVALYVDGNPYTFVNWFLSNRAAIAKKIGIKSYSYGYRILGHEVYIYFNVNCDHANMTYVPGIAPDCNNPGLVAHYECKCNKWFTDSEATQELEHHHDLVLPALGHDYSKLIRTPEYLIHTPENCKDAFAYYYACSRCEDSAGNQEATKNLFYLYGNGEHDYALTDGHVLCQFCGKEATVGAAWANNKLYTTLSEAISYTKSGTITMLKDAQPASVTVPAGVTLDINGYSLKTDVLLSFGDVIDSRNGVGCIHSDEFYTSENSQVILRDSAHGHFKLFDCEMNALGEKVSGNTVTFGFCVDFTNPLAYELLATGTADFTLETYLDYGSGDLYAAFDNALVVTYAQKCLQYPHLQTALLLRVTGLDYLQDGTELMLTPYFYTLDGGVTHNGITQCYIK